MAEAVIIATTDSVLQDDLFRIAAAANVAVGAAADIDRLREAWASAAMVLVGADLVNDLARTVPSRRPGVIVISDDDENSDLYRHAVSIGAEDVAILPSAEPWLAERLAAVTEPGVPESAMVSVIGGRGGAGASVLAAALALTGVKRGLSTLLVDGDPLGGGVDLLLGQERAAGTRWSDLVGRRGRIGVTALRNALPHLGGLALLSWDRSAPVTASGEEMRAILRPARRGFSLVVVDLPRRVDDAAGEVLRHSDLVLIVVPAEVRATAAAAQVLTEVHRHARDIRLVVRLPSPGDLPPDAVAEALDLPSAGTLATDRRLARALERGGMPDVRPRAPLGKLCGRLLDLLCVTEQGGKRA